MELEADDAQRLTPPRIYLLRIAVFLILVGFVAFILYRQILTAFNANPGLNALIVGVLAIGILFTVRQVFRLFREVRWVNRLRDDAPARERDAPVLLGPIAAMLGETAGRSAISTGTMRALLDSVGSRLDEGRDVSRYLAGVLVFLGLLGTFWGLLETVGSVARVIQNMGGGSGGGDTTQLFDELKTGLAAPLGGMGISFSSSLFGLAGSLVLGFLDLQAGQAQNRFYNELEDYLAAITEHGADAPGLGAGAPTDIKAAIERLSAAVGDGGANRAATNAIIHLAEGIQGLVQHMRSEQQLIRDWVEAQADQQDKVKSLLEHLARERT